MPRCTKFNDTWLAEKDGNGHSISDWCVKKSEYEATCLVCKKNFDIRNSGRLQLLQHSSTKKHVSVATQVLSGKQQKFTFTVSNSGSPTIGLTSVSGCSRVWNMDESDKVTKAEILWTLKVVESGYSFKSCDNVCEIFRNMFPDSKIAQATTLGSSKIRYEISHGLGPFYHSEVINQIQKSDSYYTITFDEATTDAGKKQLDIHVRFWDMAQEKVVNRFLHCYILGHATSDILRQKLLECLVRNGLPLKRLLMVGSDGPAVNTKLLNDIDSKLKSDELPGLIRIGTCNLHVVHNSFRKGVEEVSHWDIDEFLDALFKWFHKYPARKEDFKEIQLLFLEREYTILRFVSNRWLSLVPVIDRVLELWNAIQEYFLQYLPKYQTKQTQTKLYQVIRTTLKNSSTKVRLLFLKSVGESFDKFLTLIQSDEPLIHVLYDELSALVRNLMSRILKPQVLENVSGAKLCAIDLQNCENSLKIEKLQIGTLTMKAMTVLSEKDRKVFLYDAKTFIIKVIQYLLVKTPLNNVLLYNIQCLHPLFRVRSESLKCIQKVAEHLPLVIKKKDIDKLLDEWKVYMLDTIGEEDNCSTADHVSDGKQRIDSYWSAVLGRKNNLGTMKYPLLSTLVKAALTLSHGQAHVERGFSLNRHLVTPSRSSLGEQMMNGLRSVLSAIHSAGGVNQVPVTPKCLKFFREANAKYKAYLDEIKKEDNESEGSRDVSFKRKRHEEELCKEKKSLQESIQQSHHLLGEANDKLSQACKTKDMVQVLAAQALLDAGHKRLTECTEKLKEIDNELCTLSKKKKTNVNT